MSDQRKKGKRSISFWLTEEERVMLEEAAKRLRLNKSDLLKRAVEDIAARVGVQKTTPNTNHQDTNHGNHD